DGEVEDCEQVARRLLLRVHVDLRPLAARHHVLDVQRVPAEPRTELGRLLLGGPLEMDPGQAVAVELSEPRPLDRLDRKRRQPGATRADAGKAGHRYGRGRGSTTRSCSDSTRRNLLLTASDARFRAISVPARARRLRR